MKEVVNIRLDKEIIDQIRNFQLLIGKRSGGFVPNRTATVERLIVTGLESLTDYTNFEMAKYTPSMIDDEEHLEIMELEKEIYDFTQAWLNNEDEKLEE